MRACQSMCVREREKYVCVKKRFMFMDEMRELYVCVCVLRVCVCVCAAHSETPNLYIRCCVKMRALVPTNTNTWSKLILCKGSFSFSRPYFTF